MEEIYITKVEFDDVSRFLKEVVMMKSLKVFEVQECIKFLFIEEMLTLGTLKLKVSLVIGFRILKPWLYITSRL